MDSGTLIATNQANKGAVVGQEKLKPDLEITWKWFYHMKFIFHIWIILLLENMTFVFAQVLRKLTVTVTHNGPY